MTPARSLADLPEPHVRLLEQLCDRFERAWQDALRHGAGPDWKTTWPNCPRRPGTWAGSSCSVSNGDCAGSTASSLRSGNTRTLPGTQPAPVRPLRSLNSCSWSSNRTPGSGARHSLTSRSLAGFGGPERCFSENLVCFSSFHRSDR